VARDRQRAEGRREQVDEGGRGAGAGCTS
jgi:hypothetical protein